MTARRYRRSRLGRDGNRRGFDGALRPVWNVEVRRHGSAEPGDTFCKKPALGMGDLMNSLIFDNTALETVEPQTPNKNNEEQTS